MEDCNLQDRSRRQRLQKKEMPDVDLSIASGI
jgi:hypothetical protein